MRASTMILLAAGALALPCVAAPTTPTTPPAIVSYGGMCDASAGVALGRDKFVVADDEHNTLQIYQRGTAKPIASAALSTFLHTGDGPDASNSDLEGSAAIGGRVYWIASHGNKGDGSTKKKNHRFFATETTTEAPFLKPAGDRYEGLWKDMLDEKRFKRYQLSDTANKAPKDEGGFSIEGLAAAPNGALLIGMRNPIRNGKTLIAPLLNPADLVDGKDKHAKFGAMIELDLKGLGIRSIELVGKSYLIVAGAPGKGGEPSVLYRWEGPGKAAVLLPQVDFTNFNPEALFAIPGTDTVQILSDDGTVQVDGVDCKNAAPERRSFRSMTVKP